MPKKTNKGSSSTSGAPENILKILESLAETIVLCDPKDYKGLADMHTAVETIAAWTREAGLKRASAIAGAVKERIEQIILEYTKDANADVDLIGEGISALQGIVRDGRPEAEVEVPEALISAEGGKGSGRGINLPPHIDEEIFEEFLSRQPSVLEDMEALILAIEHDGDQGMLAELRRIVHTLKGESALLGMKDVESLCHAAEDLIGQIDPAQLIDPMLALKDWLGRTFEAFGGKSDAPAPATELLERFQSLAPGSTPVPAAIESKPTPAPAKPPAAAVKPVRQVTEETFPHIVDEETPLEGDLELISDFVSEAMEHLENADVHLLTLETDPLDQESLNAVFRAFHTIKGVSGFLKLTEIGSLAHEAENLLDKARRNEIVLHGGAIDVTFDAVDALKRLVNNLARALESGSALRRDDGIPRLIGLIKKVEHGEDIGAGMPSALEQTDYRVGEILLGSGKISTDDIERALDKQKLPPAAKKLGEILVEDIVTSSRTVERALEKQNVEPEHRLGEILVEEGAVDEQSVESALAKQEQPETPRLGEILVREGVVDARDVAQALRQQQGAGSAQRIVKVKETVKVDADRLDRLLDLIGELVIAESMVTQSRELVGIISSEFARQVRHLDKITRELQEMGTSLRMVPVRPIFQKMARLVRDLAIKSGKAVEFNCTGEDTELDKSVVDRIGDPLVHMVRNSIDHGIEATSEERIKAGKPPRGSITLRSFHKGGSIFIEIEDDGRGLNKQAILKKARERGLVKEGQQLSEKEIFALIFEPGFSTAAKVTDVSGRGVGMDVVRKNIEHLRGQVEIRSEEGKGTTFTLRLPLTLAIIDGMVVKVGEERYIVPTLSVVRAIRPESESLSTVLGRGELLQVQGQLVPIFRLHRLFAIGNSKQDVTNAIAVVVEDDGKQTGLMVDELLGQQQIVIKSLGSSLKNVDGLAGGAIMPDGRVGLILDVNGLVKLANSGEVDYDKLAEKMGIRGRLSAGIAEMESEWNNRGDA